MLDEYEGEKSQFFPSHSSRGFAARFRGSVAQTSTKQPATQASEQIDQDLIDQQFRRDFQYFGVNSSLKWRRSRLAAAYLQALSPSLLLTVSAGQK